MKWHLLAALSLIALSYLAACAAPPSDALEKRLMSESPGALAKAARRQGDPARGALVFYQPGLACAKCHVALGEKPALGPDLVRYDQRPADDMLVESILNPSKAIRKGFESLTLVTTDGATFTVSVTVLLMALPPALLTTTQ